MADFPREIRMVRGVEPDRAEQRRAVLAVVRGYETGRLSAAQAAEVLAMAGLVESARMTGGRR